MYDELLAMYRRLSPGDNRDTARTLSNLGKCLVDLDRPADALPKFEEGLAMIGRLYPGDHPEVARQLHNLGFCLQKLDRPREALENYTAAVEMRLRTPGWEQADTGVYLQTLAQLRLTLGDHAGAEASFRECLSLRRAVLGPDDPVLFNTVSLLGSALAGQAVALRDTDPDRAAALFAEAEPLLVDGYTGMKGTPGAPPARVREALERIVAFYEAWDKPDKAAEYRALLTESSAPLAP